ncbi:MAG: adenosine kinase [Magnetococcales bacterium]|nr:adenosine kinase [Magnetococcales bacterium]
MKSFDVFGIGHALVDAEARVDDAFLAAMGLEKGSMTLVDESRLAALKSALGNTPLSRSCGGSAANTVIAVAQFGGKAFQAFQVADDEPGHFFLEDMASNEVTTRLSRLPEGTTGQCLVLITPDAERTMCTCLGISVQIDMTQIALEDLAGSGYSYVEGYLVSSPGGRQAAVDLTRMARGQGVATALTFSDFNMIKFFREGFEEILAQGIDLLFCNEQEALMFAGSDDLLQALAALRQRVGAFAVTLGGRGALLWDGAQTLEIPGVAVVPVNTNGAGDLFAGAFLYGISHGFSYERAGRLACQAASVLVTQPGARLLRNRAEEILGNLQEWAV